MKLKSFDKDLYCFDEPLVRRAEALESAKLKKKKKKKKTLYLTTAEIDTPNSSLNLYLPILLIINTQNLIQLISLNII